MIMNGDRVDAMDSSREVECDAQLIAVALYFMFLVCAPTMEMDGVKFCGQDTGTNLHTEERNERFSTLELLASSVWRHLSCSPFCHVLSGAISIITRAGTRAHVHFVTMFGDPSATQQTQKTWPHTSTLSTHQSPS